MSLILWSALGCRVVQAPETLEELVVFAFEHHDDTPELVAMEANLTPLVEAHLDEMHDGYAVNQLTADDLAAAGVEDADVTDILGAMGAVDYRHDLDTMLDVMTRPNKDELFPDTWESYTVVDETDRACFLAHTCDRYDFTIDQVVKVQILGKASSTLVNELRWVPRDDAPPFLVWRTLGPTPIAFSSDIMAVNQQYSMVAIVPTGEVARRVESFWVDAAFVGVDVPQYTAVNMAVKQMTEHAGMLDDFVDQQAAGG